ncbi:peptidase U4 [Clostridium botulinum]|uniref:Sporulation sigma-E factor-processing peptidase n=1 Tax=Clostridium botulinum TaxID=1491 RepID=A0A0C2N8I6_CLOBO|nr:MULTISPECIES: sigma-E processing peptidase SpoIIGA [Clostridium]ACD54178.1 sigma-E processing peptidase SpoIIGA [Clostridium botulinum E3 str. Alaska E43]AJF29151.1 peptidase U4 [Clostridium botulinum]AJF32212.1 peptidase U4 [Clostridium botulinum]EES50497.1 sigma-E processing peptidase SpoIIGA [Clostridium botulinum E1 str. 'BoNT E Beluga']KAI3350881.1 sigma-E processing peptidase SpoIIGA [Clostridium botulinum]
MEVYIDILILENFIINLFLMILTMKILKYKVKDILLICSGFIGALYTIVLLFPKLDILTSFPCRIIILYIMIRISYGKKGFINIIKAMGIFLLLTFTLSGLCFMFSLNQNEYLLGESFEISKYSMKYLILGGMIIYMFFNRLIEYVKNKLMVNNFKFSIQFEVAETMYDIKGFLDTGNELREPVSNLPCILIEQDLVSTINFNSKDVYYIPYSAIGYGGNLKGIKVESIKIKGEKFYNEVDAIICPCNEKLSKENDFNALLSRGVI